MGNVHVQKSVKFPSSPWNALKILRGFWSPALSASLCCLCDLISQLKVSFPAHCNTRFCVVCLFAVKNYLGTSWLDTKHHPSSAPETFQPHFSETRPDWNLLSKLKAFHRNSNSLSFGKMRGGITFLLRGLAFTQRQEKKKKIKSHTWRDKLKSFKPGTGRHKSNWTVQMMVQAGLWNSSLYHSEYI